MLGHTNESFEDDQTQRRRHKQFNAAFYHLFAQLEKEGMMKPDLHHHSSSKIILSALLIFSGLVVSYWFGASSTVWYDVGLVLITLGLGQLFLLRHEARQNNDALSERSQDGLNRIFQIFSFGFLYGLSVSSTSDDHQQQNENQEMCENQTVPPECEENKSFSADKSTPVLNKDMENLINRLGNCEGVKAKLI